MAQVTDAEYKAAAEHGFSKDDLDGIVGVVHALASKVMVEYVRLYVEASAAKLGIGNKIKTKKQAKDADCYDEYMAYNRVVPKLAKAQKAASKVTGHQSMTFEADGAHHTMQCQLAVVDIEHVIKIAVPADKKLTDAILTQMDALVDMASQYYVVLLDQWQLTADLAVLNANTDCSTMKLNKNNRTLVIDTTHPHAVGLHCYYVDDAGKPLLED